MTAETLNGKFRQLNRNSVEDGPETDAQITAIKDFVSTAMYKHVNNCLIVSDPALGRIYKSFLAIPNRGVLVEMWSQGNPELPRRGERLAVHFLIVPGEREAEEGTSGEVFGINIPLLKDTVGQREADSNAQYSPEQLKLAEQIIKETIPVSEAFYRATYIGLREQTKHLYTA